MALQDERGGVHAYYLERVVPGVFERLPQVFPEFGWRPDPRGWVAPEQGVLHAPFRGHPPPRRWPRTRRRETAGGVSHPRRLLDALDRIRQRRHGSKGRRIRSRG